MILGVSTGMQKKPINKESTKEVTMPEDVFMYKESAKARRPIEGRKETLREVTKETKKEISQGCRVRYNKYRRQVAARGGTAISLAKWAGINC